MSSFVLNPNLPIDASCVIIGEKYYDILEHGLNSLGIKAILVPENPNISSPVSCHADMSILYTGNENIWLAPYLKNSEFEDKLEFLGLKIHQSDIVQSKEYPHDVSLNICVLNKLIICSKWADSTIVDIFTNAGAKIIRTKQGYARCSVCPVSKNAVITADRGIADALKSENIDVLLISSGHIDLPGYDYGFIGGSSFKISENKIAFTGRLDAHPDKNAIEEFLGLHNIEPVYLTEHPIFDIGGAIPLYEK